MSKLTEQLGEVGVHNAHLFAGHGNAFVMYLAADHGWRHGAMWRVARPGFLTDPKGPWYNYGNKTFVVFGRHDKLAVFEEAKAWASERFGIKEWARTPYGSWMDAEFVKARLKELRAQLKAKGAA